MHAGSENARECGAPYRTRRSAPAGRLPFAAARGHTTAHSGILAAYRATVSDALPAPDQGNPAPAPEDHAGQTTLGSFTWDVDDGQMSWSATTLSSVHVRPDDARRGWLGLEGCIPAKDKPRIASERARSARDATSHRLHYSILSSDGLRHQLTEIGWRLSEGNSYKCRFAGS
jgi:hypothetical protein